MTFALDALSRAGDEHCCGHFQCKPLIISQSARLPQFTASLCRHHELKSTTSQSLSSLISISFHCPYSLPVKAQASLSSLFLAPAIFKSTRSHSLTKNISQRSSPQIYHISLGGIIFHHKAHIQQYPLFIIMSHLLCPLLYSHISYSD